MSYSVQKRTGKEALGVTIAIAGGHACVMRGQQESKTRVVTTNHIVNDWLGKKNRRRSLEVRPRCRAFDSDLTVIRQ